MERAGQKRGGGRAYQSVLEPHLDFIRALRKQRQTWQEIADRLRTEKGLNVSLYAAYRFCQRRAKRKPSWEAELDGLSQTAHPQPAAIQPDATPGPFRRPDRNAFNPDQFT